MIMPFFNLLVTISVLGVVLYDLIGFEFNFGTGDNDVYAGKEYTKVRQVGNRLYDGRHRIKINRYKTDAEMESAKRNRLI